MRFGKGNKSSNPSCQKWVGQKRINKEILGRQKEQRRKRKFSDREIKAFIKSMLIVNAPICIKKRIGWVFCSGKMMKGWVRMTLREEGKRCYLGNDQIKGWVALSCLTARDRKLKKTHPKRSGR